MCVQISSWPEWGRGFALEPDMGLDAKLLQRPAWEAENSQQGGEGGHVTLPSPPSPTLLP